MTIIEKIELYGHKELDAVEHAAVRLVGEAADAETSLKTVLSSSPMFQTCWAAGQASAIAHGIPVVAIENEFEAVMAKAQEFVAGLKSPPPAPPAAA
ncbi:MAG TPA: hypothetical protein VGL95_14770 [Acetobacteraceae bacterium]